jgi:spore maturation protein B
VSMSIWIIPLMIGFILAYGTWKRVPTYETFVEGGKEGLSIAVSIVPYLVGMMVAISVFRASGAMAFLSSLLKVPLEAIGVPTEIVPLALVRPISGTGALAMTTDIISTYGPDSFIGRLASTMQGSTDTTLYVITVYFGAIGIKRMGNALKVGLLADLVGIAAAILFVTLVFG